MHSRSPPSFLSLIMNCRHVGQVNAFSLAVTSLSPVGLPDPAMKLGT